MCQEHIATMSRKRLSSPFLLFLSIPLEVSGIIRNSQYSTSTVYHLCQFWHSDEQNPGWSGCYWQVQIARHKASRKGTCSIISSPLCGSSETFISSFLYTERYYCVVVFLNPGFSVLESHSNIFQLLDLFQITLCISNNLELIPFKKQLVK